MLLPSFSAIFPAQQGQSSRSGFFRTARLGAKGTILFSTRGSLVFSKANGIVACKEWTILKIILKNIFPFAIPKDIDEVEDRSNPDRLESDILGINRESL